MARVSNERLRAALAAMEGGGSGGGGAAADALWGQFQRGFSPPQDKRKKREGWSFGRVLKNVTDSPLGTALEVLDAPRAALFSAGKEIVDLTGKNDQEASWSDLWQQTVDKDRRIYGGDILFGSAEKGIGGVLDRDKTPGWVQGLAGFTADVGLDPLTYVGGVGLARGGAKQVAEEVARGASRSLTKAAAKKGFREGGEETLESFLKRVNDLDLNTLKERGAAATQQARRKGVKGVSQTDLMEFTGGRAQRGLGFKVPFGPEAIVPGTQSRAATALGSKIGGAQAAIGDLVKGADTPRKLYRALGGADAEVKALARGTDPTEAFKATASLATKSASHMRAKGLSAEWARQFSGAYKNLSTEERKVALRALRGDPDAVRRLGSKHSSLRKFFDDVHQQLTEAGVRVNRIEDYAPNILTEEARKILGAFDPKDVTGQATRKFFEKARNLRPGKGIEFLDETFDAATNAELVDKATAILRKKAAGNPKIADELRDVETFLFSENLEDIAARYIRDASNRVALNEAAQRLADLGIGVTAREAATVLSDEAKPMKALLEKAGNVASKKGKAATRRADRAEAKVEAVLADLAEARKGQLFEDAAGNALDRPLTDAAERAFAEQAVAAGREGIGRIRARLTQSQRADQLRGVRRWRAAERMERRLVDLERQLDTIERGNALGNLEDAAGRLQGDVARIQREIEIAEQAVEGTRVLYQNRIDEAVNGTRTNVVDPIVDAGDATLYARPRMLPEGWTMVDTVAAEHTTTIAHLDDVRKSATDFLGYSRLTDSAASAAERQQILVEMAEEMGLNPAEGIDEWANLLANDPRARAQTFTRIRKGIETHIREINEQIETAAKRRNLQYEADLARMEYGVPSAPLYHGTSNAFVDDKPLPRTGETFGNKEGPGFYTTDNSREVMFGETEPGTFQTGYTAKEQGVEPRVYGYEPVDPDAVLLDLQGTYGGDILVRGSDELLDAMDNWAGGSIDEAHRLWGEADEIGDLAPPLAFFADDMHEFTLRWAREHPDSELSARLLDDMERGGVNFADGIMESDLSGVYAAWRTWVGTYREYEELASSLLPSGQRITQMAARESADADTLLWDYLDHLYDDFNIRGWTHRGGGIMGDKRHDVSIWFHPESDLRLVGKADYSAALQKVRLAEVDNALKRKQIGLQQVFDEMDGVQARRAGLIHEREVTAAEVRRLRAQRSKYGKQAGKVTRSRQTEHLQTLAQDAAEQQDIAEQFLADTVEAAAERQMVALQKARRIDNALRGWGDDAPRTLRESAAEYVDTLREGARWGKVQQQAVEAGDAQLARVAALEQAAHAARAEAIDMGGKVDDLTEGLANLPTKTVERMTETFKEGAYREIKAGVGTPQEVADWLLHVDRLTTPEGMRGALKKFDRVVGWLKDYQIMTPGFHVRNSMGAWFNNALAGIDDASYLKFFRLHRKWKKAAKGGGRLTSEERRIHDAVVRATGRGQIGSEFSSVTPLEALGGRGRMSVLPTRRFVGVELSRRAGTTVEFSMRGALAYDSIVKSLKAGNSIDDAVEEAVGRVATFHFDYDDLSAFEQGVKKVVPFYTWTRKNVPLQMQQIVKNPKWYSRYEQAKSEIERLSDGGDEFVPSWFKDNLAIRLPWMRGGGHVYAMPDLPMRDLNRVTDPQDLLTMLTPVVKTPIELKFNKQMFKDLPLRDDRFVPLHPALEVIPGMRQALSAIGVGQEADGQYFVTEKDMYVMEQGLPLLGRMRRLAPNEGKFQARQLTSWLSFFGLGSRSNTKAEQDIARYYEKEKPKADAKQRQKALQRALDALSE